MRFLQGMSIAETAKVLGRSDGAIKQLQLRGGTQPRQADARRDPGLMQTFGKSSIDILGHTP